MDEITIGQQIQLDCPYTACAGKLTEIEASSIEQGLEAGLDKATSFVDGGKASFLKPKITRIFLPAAKYRGFVTRKHLNKEDLDEKGNATFHDIPVFSYSGEEIIYCTDN